MFAIVYRCRREGVLLDRHAIQASPVRGELRVQQRGFNSRMAVLLKADGEHYALPVLDKVRLLALNETGVLLKGMEVHPPRGAKGNGPMYPQTWWCILRGGPVRTQGSPAEARAMERERQAREFGAALNRWPTRRGTFTPPSA
ncbi:hypothetical protein QTH97_34400 [Variovorax sp. J22R24]|uniref:hypothetical protein n=1 Tax=Variovorax gracilis TaxID=3053502 RepID=UPI0025757CBC|nr:hypothetical protein [Variovorax sp. J22R24]MDM0110037.1 hypothetical protein [Variovorax sp. J22R24]